MGYTSKESKSKGQKATRLLLCSCPLGPAQLVTTLAKLELHRGLPRRGAAPARPKSRLDGGVGRAVSERASGLAEDGEQGELERNLEHRTDPSCRDPGPWRAKQKEAQFWRGAPEAEGRASNETNQPASRRPEVRGRSCSFTAGPGLGCWVGPRRAVRLLPLPRRPAGGRSEETLLPPYLFVLCILLGPVNVSLT